MKITSCCQLFSAESKMWHNIIIIIITRILLECRTANSY